MFIFSLESNSIQTRMNAHVASLNQSNLLVYTLVLMIMVLLPLLWNLDLKRRVNNSGILNFTIVTGSHGSNLYKHWTTAFPMKSQTRRTRQTTKSDRIILTKYQDCDEFHNHVSY